MNAKLVRAVIGLVALGGLVWAFSRTAGEARQLRLPTVGELLGAVALAGLGLAGAVRSWVALFPPGPGRSRLASGFLIAQPAKYLPGGAVLQAAGQTGMATGPGYSTASVAAGFLVHAVIQLVAALTLGGAGFLSADLGGWRWVVALGLLSPLLLHRAWFQVAVGWAARLAHRPKLIELIPPQRNILVSFCWTLLPLVAAGTGFWILVPGIEPGLAMTITGFSAAWAVGFAAVPVPSGLGIREAMLGLLLGMVSAVVIAASIFHRLATLVAELIGVVVGWRINR